MAESFYIFTSNWVSRLFFSGHANGVIEKNAEHIFFKGEKAAAFQLRSLPAVEAKAMSLKDAGG